MDRYSCFDVKFSFVKERIKEVLNKEDLSKFIPNGLGETIDYNDLMVINREGEYYAVFRGRQDFKEGNLEIFENKRIIEKNFNTRAVLSVELNKKGNLEIYDYRDDDYRVWFYYYLWFPLADLFEGQYRDFLKENGFTSWKISGNLNEVDEIKGLLELYQDTYDNVSIYNGKYKTSIGITIKDDIIRKVKECISRTDEKYKSFLAFENVYRVSSIKYINKDNLLCNLIDNNTERKYFKSDGDEIVFDKDFFFEAYNERTDEDKQKVSEETWEWFRLKKEKGELVESVWESIKEQFISEDDINDFYGIDKNDSFILNNHELGTSDFEINLDDNHPTAEKWRNLYYEAEFIDQAIEDDCDFRFEGYGDRKRIIDKFKDLKNEVILTKEFNDIVIELKSKYPVLENINIADYFVLGEKYKYDKYYLSLNLVKMMEDKVLWTSGL